MNEVYISVDIETSGPIIARHSLLSIGACACEDISKTFKREVRPISQAQDDAAMEVVGKSLEHYVNEGVTPEMAFADFEKWILKTAGTGTPVFVGYNAGFDWGFVNWYFLTYRTVNPFGFAPLDIKALYAGLSGCSWKETSSKELPEKFQSSHTHTHDPLEDAIGQAENFMRIRAASLAQSSELKSSAQGLDENMRGRLRSLCRKADQQSSMHAILRDRYNAANFLLSLATLIPTSLLLCLVFVSDEYVQQVFGISANLFKLLNAVIALFAFSFILIQLLWKPDSRAAEHTRAVEHYSQMNYEASRLLEIGANPTIETVRLVEEKYLDRRGLPPIPEGAFNSLKQRHLRKIDISKGLSKDPWMPIPMFNRRPKLKP